MNKKIALAILVLSSSYPIVVQAFPVEYILSGFFLCFCPWQDKKKKCHDPLACTIYKCCKDENFFGIPDDCNACCRQCDRCCSDQCNSLNNCCTKQNTSQQPPSSVTMVSIQTTQNSSNHTSHKNHQDECESSNSYITYTAREPLTWQQNIKSMLSDYKENTRDNVVSVCENFLRNLAITESSDKDLVTMNVQQISQDIQGNTKLLQKILRAVPFKNSDLLLMIYQGYPDCYEKYISQTNDHRYFTPTPLPACVLKTEKTPTKKKATSLYDAQSRKTGSAIFDQKCNISIIALC